ncbi:MAG: hypothetical protein NTU66_05870 [Elusimicrobia bacterium]|nr:hypothetical protein [Elusimicrobiota bacterium]
MKHIVRIILIFFLLVAASLAVVVVAVKLYFPPAKIVHYIQTGSLGFIGRTVKIGRLSYGFKGVAIRDFSISNPLNFSSGTFLSLDSLFIGYAWHPLRPLISGRAGGVSFETAITWDSGEQALQFQSMRIFTGDKLLISSGTISNMSDFNHLRYRFSIAGDRQVLDRMLELFPALSSFQYGDTATVSFAIEGSPEGIKLTRKDWPNHQSQ